MANETTTPVQCSACGALLETGARFCGACGHQIDSTPIRQGRLHLPSGWTMAVVVAIGTLMLTGALAWVVHQFAPIFQKAQGLDEPAASEIIGTDWAAFDLPDPEQVELRSLELDEARDAGEFLRGAGARLLEFRDATTPLLTLAVDDSVAASEECGRIVDEVLIPRVGRHPAELSALASSVPEQEIALRMMDDVAAKRDFLAACSTGGDSDRLRELQAEVRFSHTMVARYLAKLEVAQ